MQGRNTTLNVFLALALLVAAPVATQAQGNGRIEIALPRGALPDTLWMKAEAIGDNPIEQALRVETDRILRDRGYTVDRSSTYAVRIELWSSASAPVPAPTNIPGYENTERRLSIVSQRKAEGQPVYLALTLYHTASGMRLWQAEAVCYGMPADAATIARDMLHPLMAYWGQAVRLSSFACRAKI